MFISKYFYKTSDTEYDDHFEIDGLSRDCYATPFYIRMFKEQLTSIPMNKPTAVLYAGGTNTHSQEGRGTEKLDFRKFATIDPISTSTVIKEVTAYMIHKYVGILSDPSMVQYANINSNACASSMFSIKEAQDLLDRGEVEQVIIITEERTTFNTIRVFSEHRIDVKAGDGFACIVLTKEKEGLGIEVTDAKWKYDYSRNPFYSSEDGYTLVSTEGCDTVKPHGTGTSQNTIAESVITDGKNVVQYKQQIGHAQGASAAIELCMMLDDKRASGNVLCTASGLGGFYGSCVVHK